MLELKARIGVKDIPSEWSIRLVVLRIFLRILSRRNVAWFLVVIASGYVVTRTCVFLSGKF